MDDGEPQTVRYLGHQITTWRNSFQEWVVMVDPEDPSSKVHLSQERIMPGTDRLGAYETAKGWLDEATPIE